MTTKNYDFTFNVGDRVHYSRGTDVQPATVVKVTSTAVYVRDDQFHIDPTWKADFIPGSFHGHTANNHSQRNIITENPEGYVHCFSRKLPPKHIRQYHNMPEGEGARWIAAGSDWRTGSMLCPEWRAFYDYNF